MTQNKAETPVKAGNPVSTAVIYIGNTRYTSISEKARELSYLTNSDINAAKFVQYLIDEYTDLAYVQLFNKSRKNTA